MYRAMLMESWREGASGNIEGELEGALTVLWVSWRDGALSNAEGELEGTPTVWRVSG